MKSKVIHLRRRRGGAICGSHGPTVRASAVEYYARLRVRRCLKCWRALIARLYDW